MNASYISLLLLLCCQSAFAQVKLERIIIPSTPDTLRLLQVKGARDADRKINYRIQQELFDGIGEGEGLRTFIKESLYDRDKEVYYGIEGVEDSVWRNDARVLSIHATVFGVAAHVWSFESGMSFDLRTGRRLQISDVFREDIVSELNAILRKTYRERIAQSKVENEVVGNDYSYESDELEACVNDSSRGTPLIGRRSISIIRNQCLSHVNQPLDIDWDVELDYTKVKPLLTDYARSLFEGTHIPIADPGYPTVHFEGSIGSFPVVMVVERSAEGPHGWYYYKKSGTPISIKGEYFKDLWLMDEVDPRTFEQSGSFKGLFDGKQYKGTWTSAKTKKQLPFVLRVF